MKKDTMKILFICKSNMFRSRIAEAYFKKINKNKKIKASSAGLLEGDYPLNTNEVNILKESGLNINGKPRGISWKLLRENDLIIITADNVPPELFKNKKYWKETKVWKIRDAKKPNRRETIRVKDSIMKKVDELVKNLEKKWKQT